MKAFVPPAVFPAYVQVSVKCAVPGWALNGSVQVQAQVRGLGRVGDGSDADAPLGYFTFRVQIGPAPDTTEMVIFLPSWAGSGVTDTPMAGSDQSSVGRGVGPTVGAGVAVGGGVASSALGSADSSVPPGSVVTDAVNEAPGVIPDSVEVASGLSSPGSAVPQPATAKVMATTRIDRRRRVLIYDAQRTGWRTLGGGAIPHPDSPAARLVRLGPRRDRCGRPEWTDRMDRTRSG